MPRSDVLYKPCLCVVAQGDKRAIVGDEVFTYDPWQYLVVPVPLPVRAEIPSASAQRPFLGLSLEIDESVLSKLLLEMSEEDPSRDPGAAPRNAKPLAQPLAKGTERPSPAVYVSDVDDALLGALVRLIEALEDPLDQRVLAPAAEREVLYRVLMGPQGDRLRRLTLQDSAAHRIASVLRSLQKDVAQTIDVASLAHDVSMSPSAFHHAFKRVTSLSPIQYLKRLRLHQARALMLQEGLGASEAAFRVGYGSPSQFSREFRRQFGAPPTEELARLRASDPAPSSTLTATES